jgi:hypothetical protein
VLGLPAWRFTPHAHVQLFLDLLTSLGHIWPYPRPPRLPPPASSVTRVGCPSKATAGTQHTHTHTHTHTWAGSEDPSWRAPPCAPPQAPAAVLSACSSSSSSSPLVKSVREARPRAAPQGLQKSPSRPAPGSSRTAAPPQRSRSGGGRPARGPRLPRCAAPGRRGPRCAPCSLARRRLALPGPQTRPPGLPGRVPRAAAAWPVAGGSSAAASVVLVPPPLPRRGTAKAQVGTGRLGEPATAP